MEVTFWGTRGSIPKAGPNTVRYGGDTSCVSVRTAAGTLVVLDAGTGIHELGQELMRGGGPVDGHLLIGHTHWDHIQGLPFFAPLFVPGSTWHVYGPRGLDSSLDHTLAGQMQYTYFPVRLHDFAATVEFHDLVEGRFEIDDVVVTTHYLHHPALTLGYRVEADGVTVVYSSDHEPTVAETDAGALASENRGEAQHVAFLRGADLVIHDAQYVAEEYPAKVGWGHSTVEYAVDVAAAAGARRLALYHHDPTRTDDEVDALVVRAHARAKELGFTGEVFAAAEGTTITLQSRSDVDSREPVVDTATRTPALTELRRAVLLGVGIPEADAALREAARLEGFAVLECTDLDGAVRIAESAQPPIVVLDAPSGRSLDDLAADARRVVEQYPEGATVAYVTTTPPPSDGIRPEITDWVVWPASLSQLRTKLRAWFLRRACRWQSAALPVDEASRLAALWDLGILDTDPEARFERYTEMACDTFDVPVALVSFVDADRQWFKARRGIDIVETPRDESFCAHAVLAPDLFVVTDALGDDRFADNPHVRGGPRVRFYAGVPLTADGQRVGTFCIMDRRPRLLGDDQVDRLRQLAQMVEAELQAPDP